MLRITHQSCGGPLNLNIDNGEGENITYKEPVTLHDINDYINCNERLKDYLPFQLHGDWYLMKPIERVAPNKIKQGNKVYTYRKHEKYDHHYTFEYTDLETGNGGCFHSHNVFNYKDLVYYIENEERVLAAQAEFAEMKLPPRKRERLSEKCPDDGRTAYQFAFLVKNGKKKLIAHAESKSDLEEKLKTKRLTRFDTVLIVEGRDSGSW